MPGFIGLPELLLLGMVVLLVFGPKRLPEMGRSLGRGMKEFKDSVTGDGRRDRDEPSDAALPVVSAEPVVAGEPAVVAVPRERDEAA